MSLLFGSRGWVRWRLLLFRSVGTQLRIAHACGHRGPGFILVSLSYVGLSLAPNIWLACLAVALGHAGTSIAWYSPPRFCRADGGRFRGRVFSADFAGLFLSMSAVSFLAGRLVDQGVSVRVLAFATGAIALLPAALWLRAQAVFPPGRYIKMR